MPGDKMEIVESFADSSEEIRKKRIEFLKTTRNIYRARALSLNSACHVLMNGVFIPEHMKNYDCLRDQIRCLHNDISFLMSFQDSISLIHNSLTSLGVTNLNNPRLKCELQEIVSELSFFSKSIRIMYEERISEIENMKMKQNYSLALADYQKNLDLLKEKQKGLSQTSEETRRLQKAEIQVNKINFIREMKLILIGKFAGNSEQFELLQQFRTSFRRSLTVDDFCESWDVGLK